MIDSFDKVRALISGGGLGDVSSPLNSAIAEVNSVLPPFRTEFLGVSGGVTNILDGQFEDRLTSIISAGEELKRGVMTSYDRAYPYVI